MKRRLLAGGAMAALVAAGAAGAFLALRSGGGGAEPQGGTRIVLERAGKPVSFTIGGETHTAKLIETVGSSARVAFSSDAPSEVTLTEGRPVEVDLTSDSVDDASVTATQVSADSVQLLVAPLAHRSWDESGFRTQGGFRPYDHSGNAGGNDLSVVQQGGSYLLFYVSGDHKLNWERYDATGALVSSPELALGTLDPGAGNGKVLSVDAAALGSDLALATTTNAGLTLRRYDAELTSAGQPLYLGRSLAYPVVVPVDGTPYVVASGRFDSPQDEGGPDRLIVSEADLDGSPSMVRQRALTAPSGRERDSASDAAYDAASGSLIVAYKHRLQNNDTEIRLAAFDPKTLATDWTSVVAAADHWRGPDPDLCLAASGGKATVVWRTHDPVEHLHVTEADLASGSLSQVWQGRSGVGAPRSYTRYPCELLHDGSRLLRAYYDWYARPEAPSGSPDRGRFVLWAWDGKAWADAPLVLDGGKPLYADPMFDLDAFDQAPTKAVCGAPVALKGTVVNRGSRKAYAVTVEATVNGHEVGSAPLGIIKAASTADFSIQWTVPADLTADQVEVSYSLATSSQQYTTGNDEATSTVLVRQKGLVTGRVVNASSDIKHETGWYPSLENATVTIGGHTVLTDVAGTFQVDDLDFGTYPVTVEKEGFNRLETQITVSRTKPLAFVSAELDDHGVVTLRVVDEAGQPLDGVDVYLKDYGEHEHTPASGELSWDISAHAYTFSFVKRGYRSIPEREVTVALGQTRTETITMEEVTTAFLGGRVVDKKGAPVAGATVKITNARDEVVAQPVVDAGGSFGPVELLAKPAQGYTVTVSGNGLTLTDDVLLYGGDDFFLTYGLVPGRGELRLRSATEGYTSWMIKAGWPGLGEVSGTDMYVWYGNYAISVGAEYWKGTDELSAVDVSVWGGTYETHATKSELDFSGWFEPPETGSVFDITKWADIPGELAGEHSADLLDITGSLVDGFTGKTAEDSIVTGQGNELLTWKEARSDFNPEPEFDSAKPLESLWNVVDGVPHSFAIPIVIGGSSEQQTAVRVDQVDVVRLGTGQPVDLSDSQAQWYSFQGPAEGADNQNGRRYEVEQNDVAYDDVVVYVWLTVQKYWQGAPGGTCFEQRQKQVVVFHPGPQRMQGFIASGDLYRDPSRLAQ
jgi:hypothetical protein